MKLEEFLEQHGVKVNNGQIKISDINAAVPLINKFHTDQRKAETKDIKVYIKKLKEHGKKVGKGLGLMASGSSKTGNLYFDTKGRIHEGEQLTGDRLGGLSFEEHGNEAVTINYDTQAGPRVKEVKYITGDKKALDDIEKWVTELSRKSKPFKIVK